MRAVVLLVLLTANVLANEAPNPKLKNETAPGRYHDHPDKYQHKDRDYKPHHRPPPLVDQFVCDLDATILVVASSPVKKEEQSYGDGNQNSYGNKNGGYAAPQVSGYGTSGGYGPPSNYGGGDSYGANNQGGQQNYANTGGYGQPTSGGYGASGGGYNGGSSNGYGESHSSYGDQKEGSYSQKSVPNAVRLKCSHIATRSEHDCNSCCALAARRDHSVSKKDIFGFIIDAGELINSEYGVVRHKRNSGAHPPPSAPAPSYSAPTPPASGYNNPSPPAPGYQSTPAPSYSGPSSAGYQAPPPPPGYDSSSPSYSAPAPGGYPAPTSSYPVETPAPEYGQPGNDYSSPSGQGYSSGPKSYSSGVDFPSYLQHPVPPKNGRCVCCAPKGYEHQYERPHRHHHHEHRHYDDSDEY